MRGDGHLWLAGAIGISLVLVGIYYATHPYPAYGAGLFLAMADQIRANGYLLPTTIPHYTEGGVPFAYPPLTLYVVAVFLDLGVDPIALTRVYSGVVTVLCLPPFYALTHELLDDERSAGVATVLFAVTPFTLRWHLTAGGIVRAPSYLLTIVGLYCGVKLFETNERRWLATATLLFGLTVLAHPTYAAFFGLSYLVLYALLDRSRSGLVDGAVVAVGGGVLSLPWLLTIVSRHGVASLSGAAATHGGLLDPPSVVISELLGPLYAGNVMSLLQLLTLVGAAVLVWRRRFVVPALFVLAVAATDEPRFAIIPGDALAAVTLCTLSRGFGSLSNFGGRDWPRMRRATRWAGHGVVAVALALLVVSTGFYAAGTPLNGGTSLPQYVDEPDAEAMSWANERTPPDATFVVLGDTAEWFPYLADRTMLVGPWGVEWVSPKAYRAQLGRMDHLSDCHTERCLTNTLGHYDLHPDYVYVPKGRYSALFSWRQQQPSMRRTLVDSERYQLVFENEDVMVFRVTGDRGNSSDSSHSNIGITRSPGGATHALRTGSPLPP